MKFVNLVIKTPTWQMIDERFRAIAESQSGIKRFSGLRWVIGLPHWVWALAVCGLFFAVGTVVVDDYGISWDESTQRALARTTVQYVLGQDPGLSTHWDRFYGVGFEMPLFILEKLLGLEDNRDIYLLRHMLTHLFFLAGGFFCYLLVYQMSGSRLLALLSILIFLLHPRLYAHSFFNTKDVPFMSMFMISLYFVHRAFRKDTLTAFLACGVAVGLLTNMRIIGIMLFPAVLAMRSLDFYFASLWDERKRLLTSAGVFATATLVTLYLTWPWLWGDPIGRFAEAFMRMPKYPNAITMVFRGELISSIEPPWDYLPTWFAITTPPVTLLLGALGIFALAYHAAIAPRGVIRNTDLRFGLLLVGCFTIPVLAAILLESNLYNGWRQMYFIYAPFCLLAAIGIHWLVSVSSRLKMGERVHYWLAIIGLITTVFAMIQLHPYQSVYFNFLVDKGDPEQLNKQYDMDYWGVSVREGLEHLLERYPSSVLYVAGHGNMDILNLLIIPESDRNRIVPVPVKEADFYISFRDSNLQFLNYYSEFPAMNNGSEPIFERKAYNSAIMSIYVRDPSLLDVAGVESSNRLRYERMISGTPIISAKFDIYLNENHLIYVKDPCAPTDAEAPFFLHILPVDVNDLPGSRRSIGFDNYGFQFAQRGARQGERCMAIVSLPDEYAVASIVTGQWISKGNIEVIAIAATRIFNFDRWNSEASSGDYGRVIWEAEAGIRESESRLAHRGR